MSSRFSSSSLSLSPSSSSHEGTSTRSKSATQVLEHDIARRREVLKNYRDEVFACQALVMQGLQSLHNIKKQETEIELLHNLIKARQARALADQECVSQEEDSSSEEEEVQFGLHFDAADE